ncbi:MAG TPA: NAD-dependent epimerase/dehydratase family protein [Chthoniobacterales bacterium]
MKVLLTGACGFVGSSVARALLEHVPGLEIIGLDNFTRPGSETNRASLRQVGIRIVHGDLRLASDLEPLPAVDWVIDAAANPSVLAGVDGKSSSRQVVEYNLLSTVNLLEYCRRVGAGFLLLSTSRVYSIPALATLPLVDKDTRFELDENAVLPPGISADGIDQTFSVAPPVSLYGATKLASEILALEYHATLGVPVWINRCGVLAGAGQFGRPDQGIIAYWINSYLSGNPLKYIGFGGAGHQVRDALHPRDLAQLVATQLTTPNDQRPLVVNLGGGMKNSFSLAELTSWSANRFGNKGPVDRDDRPRPLDLPWIVMDNTVVTKTWNWRPTTPLVDIYEEIAQHALQNPDWLSLSADG